MLLRPGICDTGRPVVGAQPTHLRRQQREAARTIWVMLISREHTRGEGPLKAIDGSSELRDVGILDDDGDGTKALLEQPAGILQGIDRRLKDRGWRGPALIGRLDKLNHASTRESQLLES